MIILDTNVISESTMKVPSARVMAWLDAQSAETLYLTSVTVGELRYGIAAMPAGRRRDGYVDWLEKQTIPTFSGRVVPYDLSATVEYARLMAQARAAGVAVSVPDGMIAAVAAAMGFAVATRDTTPFEAAGIPVINPWR